MTTQPTTVDFQGQAFNLANGRTVTDTRTRQPITPETATPGATPAGTAPVNTQPNPSTSASPTTATTPTTSGAPAGQTNTAGSATNSQGANATGDNYKNYVRVTIGSEEFSSNAGQILEKRGTPVICKSSYLHSYAELIINDPSDTERPKIEASLEADCEVEWGFLGGAKQSFKGKLYDVGRVLPDGTYILVIDNAYQMQSGSGSSVQYAGETAAPQGASSSGLQVISTFEGEASFYGGGDGFDGKQTASGEIFDANKLTAAHKTLPFETQVRVTNKSNGKQVTVTINDRGPFARDRVLDLSKGAAIAVGMVDAGRAEVRAEVLGAGQAEKSGTEGNQGTAQPAASATATTTAPADASGSTAQAAAPSASPTTATASDVAASGTNQQMLASAARAASGGKVAASPLETFIGRNNLKFLRDTSFSNSFAGSVRMQLSQMNFASLEAQSHGDVIVADGDTVRQVAPGAATPSGVTIDYVKNRSCFVGNPRLTKKTPLQLSSPIGSLTVTGYSMNDKTTVGATVVTPGGSPPGPPGGAVAVPEWGQININDKIPGQSTYTWGDATKNGSRVPQSKAIMEGIVRIAPFMEQICQQYGTKFIINSWYRDPRANAAAGSSSGSRHLQGDAIDFDCPDLALLRRVQNELDKTWPGGLGYGYPRFVHIDARHLAGRPKARWPY